MTQSPLTRPAVNHELAETPVASSWRTRWINCGLRVIQPAVPAPTAAPDQPQKMAGAQQNAAKKRSELRATPGRVQGFRRLQIIICSGRARALPIMSCQEWIETP